MRRPGGIAGAVAAVTAGAFVLLAFATDALAQISPGDLSHAHADLEGPRNCLTCHAGKAEEMPANCLACHGDVAAARKAGHGFHARVEDQPCAKCHPEHAGRDFELIEWKGGSFEKFDHAEAGWKLVGRHAELKCRECHQAKFQVPAFAGLTKRKDPGRSWLGLETKCAGCHEDVHKGSLGEDCASCHGNEKFKPASAFDHAKSTFPLTGKHVEVACEKCHKPTAAPKPGEPPSLASAVFRPLAHDECSACHADPHAGRLGAACAKCHVTESFKRVPEGSFDHAATRFALHGKHASLECAACHDPDKAWGKKPAFDACARCHADPHRGQATLAGKTVDCAGCHDERAFRPATYTVEQHAATRFALAGKHASVACAKCHRRTDDAAPAKKPGFTVAIRPEFQTCRSCHADAHAGQLAARPDAGACEGCHDVNGWKPSRYGIAEHAALRLPLTGRHAGIPCAGCHGPERRDLPALPGKSELGSAGVLFAAGSGVCRDCHQDPHAGAFTATTRGLDPADCGTCHGGDAFDPATVSLERHRELGFALEGAHAAVPCIDCHRNLNRRQPASTLVLAAARLEPLRFEEHRIACADCHRDPHGNQFASRRPAGCDGCHGAEAFAPADRFDHDRDTKFSLKGAHAAVACARCHLPPPAGREAPVRYAGTPTACEDCHGRTIPRGPDPDPSGAGAPHASAPRTGGTGT